MMHAVLFRNHDWSRVWRGSAGGFSSPNAVISQHFGRDFRLLGSLIASTSGRALFISEILIFNNSEWLPLWSCGYDSLLLLVFSVWKFVSDSPFLLWSCCSLDDVLVNRRLRCLLAMLWQLIDEWCRSGFWFLVVCIQVFSFISMWSCLHWSRPLLLVRFGFLVCFWEPSVLSLVNWSLLAWLDDSLLTEIRLVDDWCAMFAVVDTDTTA